MDDIATTRAGLEDDIKDKGVCLICKKQFSKYTCPKCNVGYCSLPCYKNHSYLCTKTFYEENVVQLMKSQRVTDDEKVKMMMTLKKFEQDNSKDIVAEMMREEDSESDEEEDPLSKLQNMNLDETDADTILDMLSPDQREEFRESIAKGKIGNWVDVWSPWWLHEEEKPLVTQMADDVDAETIVPEVARIPKIEDSLPKLSSLTAHPPSPMLGFNLVEIIYAYAHTLRLFNGDWTSDPVDAATILSTLSSVISSNAVHVSCVSAIQDVVRRSLQPPTSSVKELSISIILDTANILSRKRFVLAALSDLRDMFLSVETKVDQVKEANTSRSKPSIKTETKPKKIDAIKQIALQTKKGYFYLVWSNDQDQKKFDQLSGAVLDEWTSQHASLQQTTTPNKPKETKPVPFIEKIK